ncbi:right-handed parallel beta-helix repeat-containing protein [Pontiella sulfatireligans]|uniref:Calx-beta domain-containing protein n=1 Tax=Pontiella sulfatireligans TaxID=2750658 RepID=A0A6C2UFG9_9BACT|nr:right-handed parallel beta-helix repeat-containing protein [Pontiella sulfatireligans]VGO18623.1 hypothetical protein SCARR_00676 [Pontiella sulfatireligans]
MRPFYAALLGGMLFCSCGSLMVYGALHMEVGATNQVDVWLERAEPGTTYQFQSSTNLMTPWENLGNPIVGDGRFHTERDFNDTSAGFYRAIETNIPAVRLELQSDLLDSSIFGRHATLAGGAVNFIEGRTEHFQAYAFDGANMLDLPIIGSVDALTLSMDVYLDDITGATTMLFDSGSLPGNVQLYLRDNHSGTHTGDGKDRDVGLVFKVHGNTGGNGVTGESVETTYRRFAEHSLDFLMTVSHERRNHPEHNWLHLAVTYAPSEKRVDFYINGMHDGTQYFTVAQPSVLDASRIGSDLARANPLIGKISDFNIYDTVLSAEQIRAKADFRQDLWAVRDIEQWTSDRTFYVDGATGSDGNDGSVGTPLSSIGEAVDRVNALSATMAPGSRIVIKPGVYREGGIVLKKNGTRFKPIIIEAETPGTVTLSGSEVWDDDAWSETAPGSGIWTHAWAYNFGRSTTNVFDETTEARYRREIVSMDGELLRPYMTLASLQAAPDPSNDAYMTDEHAFYVDEDNDLIYVRTTGDPNTSLLEVGIHEELLRLNLYFNNCEYVVIRGIRVQHSASFYGYHKGALNIVGSKYLLIEDCEIIDNGSSGLKSSGSGYNTVIRRCSFDRNGREGLSLVRGYSRAWVQDCAVEQNQWRNDLGNYTGPDLAGIGKIMFSSRLYFERTRVSKHNYTGLWADAQNWDITVDDGYFSENQGAIWFEINTLNQEAINNSCYENRNAAIIMDAESNRVENNLLKQTGLVSWRGMLASSRTVRTKQANIPDIYAAKDAVVRNNVVASAGTSGSLHHFDDSTIIPDSMISADNVYYAPYTANLFNIAGSAMPFSTWHDNYLYDSTSQLLPVGSPPFVNDGSVTISFESDWVVAPESRTALQVPIVLSMAVDDAITVDLSVEDVTAAKGADFRVIGSGQITFSPLERSRVISVPIARDLIAESEETFRLQLSNPGNASMGSITTFTVRIPANTD